MIKANKKIFSKLEKYLKEKNIIISNNEMRYINSKQDGGNDWLKNIKIDAENILQLLPTVKTFLFEYKGESFFTIIGWDNLVDIDENILIQEQLNSGSFTAIVSEFDLNIKDGSNEESILEYIFYPTEDGIVNYEGHDYNLFIDLFNPINIYRIPDGSIFKDQEIERITGFIITKNSPKLLLTFSKDTLAFYEKIFLEISSTLPFNNLLLSLVSFHWKYSFLDIYRCIEYLFPIIMVSDLIDKLNIEKNIIEFLNILESEIGWKVKEDVSIKKLFEENIDEEIVSNLKKIKLEVQGNDEGEMSNFFYGIRNSIVHFRLKGKSFATSNDTWDNLIKTSLEILYKLYFTYEEQLNV